LTDKKMDETKKKKKKCCGYPISIFFIVVNEFCERFSYYGMRAVLVLYFRYFLLWDDDLATSIYHAFVALCYLTPILGAIIADSWLGKFKTIIYLSIVYAIGQVTMAVSTIHDITDANRDVNHTPYTSSVSLTLDLKSGVFLLSLIYFCSFCKYFEFDFIFIFSVFILILFAIKNRFRHRGSRYPKREHWMDWADEKYDKLLIAQIKMVLKVLFLYIPLPMFWMLFDQKGSRWTLQATTMSGDFGAFILQPDQVQTVNPILILTLVPIMDRLIFPLIQKCGLNFSPLKRMTVGMLFAAMAFVAAALVQIEIDKTLPNFPSSSESQLKVVNIYNKTLNVTISPNKYLLIYSFEVQHTFKHTYFIMPLADLNITNLDSIEPSATSNYTLVSHGKRDFVLRHGEQWCEFSRKFGFGASYTFLIPSTVFSTDVCTLSKTEVEDMKPNSVHMALQIPQYFLITTGEVMFSVTGLQFSYSQAPKKQAGWLCTNAVGNIIVLIVAELGKLPKQWAEYVLFASLLVAVSIIFSIMAYFYTYIDPAEIEAQIRKEQGLEPEEKEKETLEMEEKDEGQKNDQEVKKKQDIRFVKIRLCWNMLIYTL
uniref:Solute carrier family 15 member 1a n=1 Tax=Cyprinus carpio carpio TaxID=630221 RepID=A0A9J7Y1N7_CYPCA